MALYESNYLRLLRLIPELVGDDQVDGIFSRFRLQHRETIAGEVLVFIDKHMEGAFFPFFGRHISAT